MKHLIQSEVGRFGRADAAWPVRAKSATVSRPASFKNFVELLHRAHELKAAADELLALVKIHDPKARLSVRWICEVVAADLKVPVAALAGPRGCQEVSWARHVAMYLVRELMGFSLKAVGKEFGGRDHGTVLHACVSVKNRMETSPADARYIADLIQFFNRPQ